MSKHISLNKKIKKQILYINDLIKNNFDKLKYFKSNFKKILLSKDNRVFLSLGIVVILTLSYFLIPTFYNKDVIQSQIKNQIFKNYDLDIQFDKKINYGLLPTPHFSAKNLIILRDGNKIGVSKNLRISIDILKFFSLNKIKMGDLVFDKTDFNFYLDDVDFFINLLKVDPNENKIFFKKSNIFFKNINDEVLFINKIRNSKFYYDSNNLQNILHSKNEIFNVPFKLIVKNDKFNKKIFTKFNSKKIRLDIESETNYDNEKKDGLLDILFINKSTSLRYEITSNQLNFISEDNKNSYRGIVDFKPFYLTADFSYEGISAKNLFDENSIFVDLINSEILNNKNLSAEFNFNVKNITNIRELNNLNLKASIEEGKINFSDSEILWKENLKISFRESLLNVDDEGINLNGTVVLKFDDINSFYSSYQVQKKNRKKIQKIQLDFVYNFNNKSFRFDNPKINDQRNNNLEDFLYEFNSKENTSFNKITFKNFINDFFKIYAG